MDQIQKIKELVAPILEKEEIQLYEVLWHNEGNMRILQIAIMRNDGSMDIDTVQTCLKRFLNVWMKLI
nr:hypothetical protein [Absiella sp. AM54-8XD]